MPKSKSLLSALTIAAVGLSSKCILNYMCSDVKIIGLSRLLDALDPTHLQHKGRKSVLTVSNHISVLDDPLMWGSLPSSHYTEARPMRWALGASDICFTNPLFAAFFRQGQVLETYRGKGIKQPAIDKAIELLNAGEWVHIFPEGKIVQPSHSNLCRLKWGIGRILLEVRELPTIIPMWLTGFDAMMPEARRFPRFLPRPGKGVSITFGESESIRHRIETTLNQPRPPNNGPLAERLTIDMRVNITRVIQDELEKLGKWMSGEVMEGIQEGKEMNAR